jgi:hypothetical protein
LCGDERFVSIFHELEALDATDLELERERDLVLLFFPGRRSSRFSDLFLLFRFPSDEPDLDEPVSDEEIEDEDDDREKVLRPNPGALLTAGAAPTRPRKPLPRPRRLSDNLPPSTSRYFDACTSSVPLVGRGDELESKVDHVEPPKPPPPVETAGGDGRRGLDPAKPAFWALEALVVERNWDLATGS